MKTLPFALFTLFLLHCLSTPVYASGDDDFISNGLRENEGGVFTLPAGTFTVTKQIVMPESTTLQGAVSENGKLLTTIKIADDYISGVQDPIIQTASGCMILYLNFDGNSEHQSNVPTNDRGKQWGLGYHNFIGCKHANDVRVAYCNFYNNLGDGFRPEYSTNIEFDHNIATKGGHDVFYSVRCEGVWAHDNYIQPRVNSALRAMDCSGVLFSNNVIVYVREYDGIPYDAGPAIQIQNDNGDMDSVEVCYNVIYYSYGPAFWVVAKTDTDKQSANIHHNVMYDAGANHGIYWAAGMIISGYDNLNIYNNVFDGSYRGGIVYYAVNNGWATKAHSDISENIFTDARPGASDGNGGYGILNQIDAQTVSSSENCYYNNPAGNTEGCSVSSSDLYDNPRETPTPSGYTWDGSKWNCRGMPPTSLNYVPRGIYDGLDPITPEEEKEFEFNNIFDVSQMEFSESGYVKQEDLKALNPEWESKGNAKAYIYLAGYEGQIKIDNEMYIPKTASECAIVLTDTKNLASRPEGQTSKLTLADEGDKLKATLKVKTKYNVKVYKTVRVGKNSIKVPYYKEKSETKIFTKIFDAPKVFPVQKPEDINVTVTYQNNSFNPHTTVTVESKNGSDNVITGVAYRYDESSASEFRLIGYVEKNENGFKTPDFKPTSTWKFSDDRMSYSFQSLYIKGEFDPEKFGLVVKTPYSEIHVSKYNYIEAKDPTDIEINPAPFVIFLVIFLIARPFLQDLSRIMSRGR